MLNLTVKKGQKAAHTLESEDPILATSNRSRTPSKNTAIRRRDEFIDFTNPKYSHVVNSDEDELPLSRAVLKRSFSMMYRENKTTRNSTRQSISCEENRGLECQILIDIPTPIKKRKPTKIDVPSNKHHENRYGRVIVAPQSPTLSWDHDDMSISGIVGNKTLSEPQIIEISEDEDETRGREGILFTYPFDGKDQRNQILITSRDTEKLKHGSYINDTLIDFFLLWLRDNAAQRMPEVKQDIHIFNCFFYPYLRETVEKGNNLDCLKKWTCNIDLFAKKHLIVPVHENDHWFVMIACDIDRCLPNRPTDQKPRIYLLDSIGVERKSSLMNLVKFLHHQTVSRHGPGTAFVEPDLVHARVPLQKNGSDCGIYLIHFVGEFLANPKRCIDLLESMTTDEEAWGTTSMDEKRAYFRNVIHDLNEEWHQKEPVTNLKICNKDGLELG
ncbi:hypothetical protein CLU79DRAFT_752320 [Phycomyces nitens]|nr:hypothetical protein CLU79DRAFT_752320 [Phycomyces nitens]